MDTNVGKAGTYANNAGFSKGPHQFRNLERFNRNISFTHIQAMKGSTLIKRKLL